MSSISGMDMNLLISMVEQRPVLWDRTLEYYKDKDFTANGWREVVMCLHSNYNHLSEKEKHDLCKSAMKKWTNVRDNWMRAHKKITKRHKYDQKDPSLYCKKYCYYDQMKFLEKVVKYRDPNYSVQEDDEDNSLYSTYDHNLKTENPNEDTDTKPLIDLHSNASLDNQLCSAVNTPMVQMNGFKQEPINNSVNVGYGGENRHILFFNSLLPSLNSFEDDEVLEFQIAVLSFIHGIKQKRKAVGPIQNLQQATHFLSELETTQE